MNNFFLAPRKKKSQSKNEKKKITEKVSSTKWDDNRNEASFDDLIQEDSSENMTFNREKKLDNESSTRSSVFHGSFEKHERIFTKNISNRYR